MTAKNTTTSLRCLATARRGACLLMAFAFSTFSVPAQAQSNAADSERANLLFKKGRTALNEGKFSDALRIYNEAWQLKQSPDIAANLALTESQLGKHRDAAEHYAFALSHLLPSSTDEQKASLAEGLENQKKEVGTLHVTLEPADSALNVDGVAIAVPASGDIFVEPGEHRCSVSHEGYETKQQTAQVSKGGSQVLWIKLVPTGGLAAPAPAASAASLGDRSTSSAPDSAPPALNENKRSRVPVFVLGGVAAAGIGTGIGFLLSAQSHGNKADELAQGIPSQNGCGAGTPNNSDCAALHDENQNRASARTVAAVSFAVGGAALAGMVTYLVWPHGGSRASSRAADSVQFSGLTPQFELARGIGTVGLNGRF